VLAQIGALEPLAVPAAVERDVGLGLLDEDGQVLVVARVAELAEDTAQLALDVLALGQLRGIGLVLARQLLGDRVDVIALQIGGQTALEHREPLRFPEVGQIGGEQQQAGVVQVLVRRVPLALLVGMQPVDRPLQGLFHRLFGRRPALFDRRRWDRRRNRRSRRNLHRRLDLGGHGRGWVSVAVGDFDLGTGLPRAAQKDREESEQSGSRLMHKNIFQSGLYCSTGPGNRGRACRIEPVRRLAFPCVSLPAGRGGREVVAMGGRGALARVRDETTRLRELTSDNPAQRARLGVLEQKVAVKLDELQRTVALLRAGDRPAARGIVQENTDKTFMDDVREQVATMQQVERDLLQQRVRESEANTGRALISIVLSAVLGLGLVGAVFHLSRTNLSERQRAADVLAGSEERLRMIMESAKEYAIITLDANGVVTSWNSGAKNLLGYDANEIIGKHGRIFFTLEDAERGVPEREMHKARTEGRAANQRWHVRKDGSRFWASGMMMTLRDDGDVRGFVNIMRDETEERHAQETLERQAQELKDADQMKNEFLATLAHELRNPLAPIRSSLEVLKEAKGDAGLIEKARSTIIRQVAQMVRLIDDLLDVSRITRGKIELRKERVELAHVIHHAVETCRPMIDGAGHEVDLTLPDVPVVLDADPVRLVQVFGNLLNNACKYTEPGGRVGLTAERQGSELVVSIKDTGIGIPPEMLPKLFDLFMQVDRSLERTRGGLGIGLTLVKRLVEMHQGTVTAYSEGPGRGSAFVVRLPIVTAIPKGEPLPKSTLQPAPARRILVVDDNRDSAESLATLLDLRGNEVQTAYDGVEAVEKAAVYRPDVILLDIGLPKMNGYNACRAIREQPWGKNIVMVALTGWGQDEDRRKSVAAGFDSHLVKPVDLDDIMTLLGSSSIEESAG
jgi:PAS domain S-box-containing protein